MPKDDVTVFSHVAKAARDADVAERVLDVCLVPRETWLCTFQCLSKWRHPRNGVFRAPPMPPTPDI